MINICYLCGKEIEEKERDSDHVPPKRFFPSRIKKKFNLARLVTHETHKRCNREYQTDEEYFFHTIGMADFKNPILVEVWHDMWKAAQRDESKRFNQMLLSQLREVAKTPKGIVIPDKVAVEYDSKRVNRVVWKIVRGLFYHEFSRFLPEATLHFVTYFHGQNLGVDPKPVVDILNIVRTSEERGQYKKIFAYRYVVNPEQKNIAAWGLLFWDRHIFLAGHHDPDCDCDKCRVRKC